MAKLRDNFEFDFAISFAGEDRPTAAKLAEELTYKGAVVFYDDNYQSELLGKKLTQEFRRIYGEATRFFVPLISKHYAMKDYTNYEWETARKERQKRKYEFILPLKLDNTTLLGLHDDVGFIDLSKKPLDSVVNILVEKLRAIAPKLEKLETTRWVATFGLVIDEILEGWELPAAAPRDYASLCDWLEEDLERKLRNGPVKEFLIIEDSRSGDTLSVRVEFQWSPSEKPLDLGALDWWEVLEVVPFDEVYSGTESSGYKAS